MWVIGHGLTHDVGHLVISAIIDDVHGMQYSALHGLQTIHHIRDGTLQDDIRSVVQEPMLVHSAQVMDLVLARLIIVVRHVVGCAVDNILVVADGFGIFGNLCRSLLLVLVID